MNNAPDPLSTGEAVVMSLAVQLLQWLADSIRAANSE